MTRRRILLLAGIVGLGIAAVALRGRVHHAAAVRATATAGAPAAPLALKPASDAERARFETALKTVAAGLARAKSGETPKAVSLQRKQVVARVNGVAIVAEELLPWRARNDAQAMSPEMLSFLLERAIDRELTRQAARAQGVELTEEQRQSVEQLRAGGKGAADPAQIEFQVRDTEAQFLLAALASKSGVASPFADASDIDKYYQSHSDEFDDLPADPAQRDAAWQKIQLQIRQRLATERQAAYQRQVRDLVGQLRADAQISNG